tara:strand:- start:12 stop:1577 length:1566 start_codon:yes stop_codon:yes gene_type:complete
VGFSGRLYSTLRENISKRDQVQLDEGEKWVPAFERQDDSRFQWHRTRSEVELGEDERRVRRTHYKELFGEKRQGKTRSACHSSLDMMRSQYRLEDGSAPGQRSSVSTLSMQDPKVVYPKLSLPQTTSSTIKLDGDSTGNKSQRSREATSYARNHQSKRADEANNSRYCWNRTQSTVKIDNHYSREAGMKASLMREAFGAPDNASLKQTLGHKDRGAAKWNKSSSEFKAFAPTQELRAKFTSGEPTEEPLAFQKRQRASIAGTADAPNLEKIMQGPSGAFAHSENGEEPARNVDYGTSTSRTFTKKPVSAPKPREHTRTKSTVELGRTGRSVVKDPTHYNTTTDCHIGVDANNKALLKPQTRFQWGRTQSKIDLKFAVDERGRTMRGKTLRERQRLEDLLLKAQGGPPQAARLHHPIGAGDSRHMASSVTLGTGEGSVSQTQHSESFQKPAIEPGYKPCARSMGDVRAKSHVPVPIHLKGTGKVGFKTWSADVFKPHDPQPMRTKIVSDSSIKGHLQWAEQD